MSDRLEALLEEGRAVLQSRKNPGHYLLNDVVDRVPYHRWVLNCVSFLGKEAPDHVRAIQRVHQPNFEFFHQAEQIFGILESALEFIREKRKKESATAPVGGTTPASTPPPSAHQQPAASAPLPDAQREPRTPTFLAKRWFLLSGAFLLLVAAVVAITQRVPWFMPAGVLVLVLAVLLTIRQRVEKSVPWKKALVVGMLGAGIAIVSLALSKVDLTRTVPDSTKPDTLGIARVPQLGSRATQVDTASSTGTGDRRRSRGLGAGSVPRAARLIVEDARVAFWSYGRDGSVRDSIAYLVTSYGLWIKVSVRPPASESAVIVHGGLSLWQGGHAIGWGEIEVDDSEASLLPAVLKRLTLTSRFTAYDSSVFVGRVVTSKDGRVANFAADSVLVQLWGRDAAGAPWETKATWRDVRIGWFKM